jgi:uncharacterized protein
MRFYPAALAAALTISGAAPAFAADLPLHTIAVQGEAATYVTPDHATVEVGVVTQSKAVGDALAQNNVTMTRVLAAIRALAIKDAQIQTSDFGVQPQYAHVNGQRDEDQPIVGYMVANKITVGVDDVSKVAQVIDTASAAGANNASQVRFQVRNRASYLDAVRKAAVANARHKAEILASAAGVTVGPALAINDNQANYYRNQAEEETETVIVTGSRIPETPIAPGQEEIIADVTIVYALR